MSKKDFKGGLNSLLENKTEPKNSKREITKSSQKGTKDKETRATFIVNESLLDKLKAMAYWDRKLIKEVVDQALQEAVANYEKRNGDIKGIPGK